MMQSSVDFPRDLTNKLKNEYFCLPAAKVKLFYPIRLRGEFPKIERYTNSILIIMQFLIHSTFSPT